MLPNNATNGNETRYQVLPKDAKYHQRGNIYEHKLQVFSQN